MPVGQRYGRISGALDVTDRQAVRLLRPPLWIGLTEVQQDNDIDILKTQVSGISQVL